MHTQSQSSERRKYERKPTTIRVEMHNSAFGMVIGSAMDISDGGAHVTIEHNVVPPIGTEVMVQFKKVIGHVNEEPVAMKVVHVQKNSVGLMFLPR